jgi:hypothetical protein
MKEKKSMFIIHKRAYWKIELHDHDHDVPSFSNLSEE